MTDTHEPRSTARSLLLAAFSIAFGVVLALSGLEVVLRFLPVNQGLMALPVDDLNPVFRFTPNRALTWSRDWNFSIVNRIRVNNAGFVNDQDYVAQHPLPLLAVVGDSYVEAAMVPYAATVHGRLAAQYAGRFRVYSYAASGAPLSQYVVWARVAKEEWGASKLAVVVISNDFDESLASYKQGPGFHHYVRNNDGELQLQRVDYAPSTLKRLGRRSALIRYLVLNLHVGERIPALLSGSMNPIAEANAQTYLGNTLADANAARIRDSQEAVDAFLGDLVAIAGWQPRDVVFLVDGIRYPRDLAAARNSYFMRMREYFIETANAAGFSVIDLDPLFFSHHERTGERFEFPTDAHWNAAGHQVAAEGLASSGLLEAP